MDGSGELAPLLTDRQWWVRYRAAQAIVGLSPRDDQRLRDIHSTSVIVTPGTS